MLKIDQLVEVQVIQVELLLGSPGNPGGNGTGGLLIIYSSSMRNYGSLVSNGVAGGASAWGVDSVGAAGGSSGGGSINVFTKLIVREGSTSASGGSSASGPARGGAGGAGSVTIQEVSEALNYQTKTLELKPEEEFEIDEKEIYYVGIDNMEVGELIYETLDENIATVDNNGKIRAISEGKTKIRITDITNENITYIYVEVRDHIKADVQEGKNFTIVLKQDGTVWSYGINT